MKLGRCMVESIVDFSQIHTQTKKEEKYEKTKCCSTRIVV